MKVYASEWEKYANIKFKYIDDGDAHVRISFDWNDDRYITWSYIGTDCKSISNQAEATLSFADAQYQDDDEFKADVLRTFGMILGLELEHRHLKFDPQWRRDVKRYWTNEILDIQWESLSKYVFDPLDSENTLQTEEYDPSSIMVWPFPKSYLLDSEGNKELSEKDIAFIEKIYPKPKKNLNPTTLIFELDTDILLDKIGSIAYVPNKICIDEGNVIIFVDSILLYEGETKTMPQNIKGKFVQIEADRISIDLTNTSIKKLHLTNTEYTHIKIGRYTSNLEYFDEIILDNIPYFSGVQPFQIGGYSKITSIPEGLFDNCPNGTNFSHAFRGLRGLKHVPNKLFSKCTKAEIFTDVFIGSGLETIPEDIFEGCINAKDFGVAFALNNQLTDVPENLFKDCPNVQSFQSAFSQCSKLTSIPSGLFTNNINVTNFSYTFDRCINLTTIPSGLFDGNINAINFEKTFYDCGNITQIPNGLFDNCPQASNFNNTFRYCSKITSIPSGLFDKNIKIKSLNQTFAYTSIRNIPPGLFDKNVNIETFYNTFVNTNIEEIPNGLFDKNINVTEFIGTFTSCHLRTIPNNLFDKNINATSFISTFSYNKYLETIPANLFVNNTKVTNFNSTFAQCGIINSSVPELWITHSEALSKNCFQGTFPLNESEIPIQWK